MRIGMEITENFVRAAAVEEGRFSLLEEAPLADPHDYEWITMVAAEFAESLQDKLLIAVPDSWQITERKRLTDTLHQNGIRSFALIPKILAAYVSLEKEADFKRPGELLYIEGEGPNDGFSILSLFENSLLLEAQDCGDEKRLKKIANLTGILFHGIWSEELTILTTENAHFHLNTGRSTRLLPSDAVLKGLTLGYEEILKQLPRFYCRLQSPLLFRPDPVENAKPDFLLPVISPLVPLLWNDYSCITFFTPQQEQNFLGQGGTLYEKREHPAEDEPLASIEITEPSGLWCTPESGSLEVLPYLETLPQPSKEQALRPYTLNQKSQKK